MSNDLADNFKLRFKLPTALEPSKEEREWLAEVQRAIKEHLQKPEVQEELRQFYMDLVLYGTANRKLDTT